MDEDDLEILNKESSKEEVDKQKSKKVKKTKIVVSNIETGFNVLYGYNEGFVADHSTAMLVGTARLRQLRIQKGVWLFFFFTVSSTIFFRNRAYETSSTPM